MHLLINSNIPNEVFGTHAGYSLREFRTDERLSLEDAFAGTDLERMIPDNPVTIVYPDTRLIDETVDRNRILSEFAIGVAAISGFAKTIIAASFTHGKCTDAVPLEDLGCERTSLTFPATMTDGVMGRWLQVCSNAHDNLPKNMPITASRFSRYLQAPDPLDAVLDLAISLESIIGSQTEIGYKFSVCLAKIAGNEVLDPIESQELLSKLYRTRSKIAHGDPAFHKEFAKLKGRMEEIRALSRAILIRYIAYLNQGTQDDWKKHLTESLLK